MIYYLNKIRDLLRAGISEDKVKYIIIGEPQNIPTDVAELGFILIIPGEEVTTPADSQRDQSVLPVDIVAGVSVREDYNSTDYDQEYLISSLDVLEGIDDNGNLKEDTVKYILRKYLTSIGLNQPEMTIDPTNQRAEQYIYAAKLSTTIYDQRNRYNN